MTFRLGQKVVCVNPVDDLVRGQIYTVCFIRETHIDVAESLYREFGGSFYPSRFRPVNERRTDISIFTKMLRPVRVDA